MTRKSKFIRNTPKTKVTKNILKGLHNRPKPKVDTTSSYKEEVPTNSNKTVTPNNDKKGTSSTKTNKKPKTTKLPPNAKDGKVEQIQRKEKSLKKRLDEKLFEHELEQGLSKEDLIEKVKKIGRYVNNKITDFRKAGFRDEYQQKINEITTSYADKVNLQTPTRKISLDTKKLEHLTKNELTAYYNQLTNLNYSEVYNTPNRYKEQVVDAMNMTIDIAIERIMGVEYANTLTLNQKNRLYAELRRLNNEYGERQYDSDQVIETMVYEMLEVNGELIQQMETSALKRQSNQDFLKELGVTPRLRDNSINYKG